MGNNTQHPRLISWMSNKGPNVYLFQSVNKQTGWTTADRVERGDIIIPEHQWDEEQSNRFRVIDTYGNHITVQRVGGVGIPPNLKEAAIGLYKALCMVESHAAFDCLSERQQKQIKAAIAAAEGGAQ